jgi:hypothetical protein
MVFEQQICYYVETFTEIMTWDPQKNKYIPSM